MDFKCSFTYINKSSTEDDELFKKLISNPTHSMAQSSKFIINALYPDRLLFDENKDNSDTERDPGCTVLKLTPKDHHYHVKKKSHITLILECSEGVAYTTNDGETACIHLNSGYIKGLQLEFKEKQEEMIGVILHELVHCWQWDGEPNEKAPWYMIEGTADFIRMKSGYKNKNWMECKGGSYTDGYSRTAYFLLWIEKKFKIPFVCLMNDTLKTEGWTDNIWKKLTSQSADNLWQIYEELFDEEKKNSTSSQNYEEKIFSNRTNDFIKFEFLNNGNKADGEKFLKIISNPCEFLAQKSNFVLNLLYPEFPSEHRSHLEKERIKKKREIKLILENSNGVANTTNNGLNATIRLNIGYVNDLTLPIEYLKKELEGVIIHELVHVWQFDGEPNTKAPFWIVEGIADYVRVKSGYAFFNQHWQETLGGNWEEGYSRTAFFLNWLENKYEIAIIWHLNDTLRTEGWSEEYFKNVLGKPLVELWNEYQSDLKKKRIMFMIFCLISLYTCLTLNSK